MKYRDIPQSGSQGNITASRNRSGPYLRHRVNPDQPATDAQSAAWSNMKDVSGLWNLLRKQQRHDWHIFAENLHSRPNLGISGRLSGCQLFKKLNRVLATSGRGPLLDPPPLPQFGPNPVRSFEIQQVRGGIAMLLNLIPKFRWADRPPLEDLMIQAWAPCHAGSETNGLYAFVGLPPTPVRQQCDFTELYMEKLLAWRKLPDPRYKVPLEGSRIFVRVVQQINGWQNERQAFHANALVPINEDLRARELARLLKRWPASSPHK